MTSMANAHQKDDPFKRQNELALPRVYEVGYGKPPESTRFKPGRSGNPRGRSKGSKNKHPSLSEERIKTLILEEAYRTIPIIEKGRKVTIPIITAILRAVAMNAAKGNNRAAHLLTTLVGKTEAENNKLARESFGSAIDYKQAWTKELARRKRLGLKLPDPVPHPDDIIVDARNMAFKIKGPWIKDEIPRYQLAAELLAVYEIINAENLEKLEALPEGPEKDKLRQTTKDDQILCSKLREHYGPRSERTKDPLIREVEDWVGVPFTPDEDNEWGSNDQ